MNNYNHTAPKRVLITGAGGTIGREALKMLHRRSDEFRVRVFDLPSAKNREFFGRYEPDLEVYYGDITRKEDLDKATKEVDFVIHLASVIPPLADEKPELVDSVNVGGTDNLVRALEQNSPQAFILFASSVAVYGDRFLDPFIKVSDPVNPNDDDYYGQGKVLMEQIIKDSKLQWTSFRLGAIMGASNHVMSGIMFRMPLRQLMEIATPKDTARAFVNGLNHREELAGRVFNLGGGAECTTTYQDFLENNFRIYGLGEFDFPLHAFATKGFHCGFYEDGQVLEDILHFRRDTLESYYRRLDKSISWPQEKATQLMAPIVKSYLLHLSEPYEAWINRDSEKIERYFRL